MKIILLSLLIVASACKDEKRSSSSSEAAKDPLQEKIDALNKAASEPFPVVLEANICTALNANGECDYAAAPSIDLQATTLYVTGHGTGKGPGTFQLLVTKSETETIGATETKNLEAGDFTFKEEFKIADLKLEANKYYVIISKTGNFGGTSAEGYHRFNTETPK